jgi:hypothetical protein
VAIFRIGDNTTPWPLPTPSMADQQYGATNMPSEVG